jgi:hypothetical protein
LNKFLFRALASHFRDRILAPYHGVASASQKAQHGFRAGNPAIRWLIAWMVLCCDPIAIVLTAAASARRATV